jgi:plasmid replication initiation protein
MSFNSNNNRYIEDSLVSLMTTAVEFNILGKDKTKWSATTLLASATIEEWIITYEYSNLLAKKLANPQIYAKINLRVQDLFKSKYSATLYELIMDYEKIWQTPMMSIEEFKKIMWTEEIYSIFKNLSLRVIKPSIEEINKITDLWLSSEYDRVGKKIVWIKFKFTIPKKKDNRLRDVLIEQYELTPLQANIAIKNYPKPYIEETIKLFKSQRAKQPIDSTPAYLQAMLKSGYKPIAKSDTHPPQKYLDSLWETKSNELIQTFIDEKSKNEFFKSMYKREWIDWITIKSMLYKWISDNYLQDTNK